MDSITEQVHDSLKKWQDEWKYVVTRSDQICEQIWDILTIDIPSSDWHDLILKIYAIERYPGVPPYPHPKLIFTGESAVSKKAKRRILKLFTNEDRDVIEKRYQDIHARWRDCRDELCLTEGPDKDGEYFGFLGNCLRFFLGQGYVNRRYKSHELERLRFELSFLFDFQNKLDIVADALRDDTRRECSEDFCHNLGWWAEKRGVMSWYSGSYCNEHSNKPDIKYMWRGPSGRLNSNETKERKRDS